MLRGKRGNSEYNLSAEFRCHPKKWEFVVNGFHQEARGGSALSEHNG